MLNNNTRLGSITVVDKVTTNGQDRDPTQVGRPVKERKHEERNTICKQDRQVVDRAERNRQRKQRENRRTKHKDRDNRGKTEETEEKWQKNGKKTDETEQN